MTAGQRVTNAREYLGYARKVTLADLPHSVLLRVAAELRRQLGQVLDVFKEWDVPPYDDTDADQAARRAELVSELPPPLTADPGTIDAAVIESLAVIPDATAHVVCGWLRAARKAEAGQLAEIRAVLAAVLSDEHGDRQFALEEIERIVTGSDR